MSVVTVRVKDRGANRVLRAARGLGSAPKRVKVGIIGPLASEDHGGLTLAALAAVHEWGIGVPERSFIRAWADENRTEIQRRQRALVRQILLGQITELVALKRLGAWAQGSIQKRIADGILPPNAESTIAKKGSSKPLIESGQLRSGVTYEVE